MNGQVTVHFINRVKLWDLQLVSQVDCVSSAIYRMTKYTVSVEVPIVEIACHSEWGLNFL